MQKAASRAAAAATSVVQRHSSSVPTLPSSPQVLLPPPPPPTLRLEATPKTRLEITPPRGMHPGHMKMMQMARDSSVRVVEGGYVRGAPGKKGMLQAALSHQFSTLATPTDTTETHLPPGSEAAAAWDSSAADKRVHQRLDSPDQELPLFEPNHSDVNSDRSHERYDVTTDCVAEALRAAKVPDPKVTGLGRVVAAEAELINHGFEERSKMRPT